MTRRKGRPPGPPKCLQPWLKRTHGEVLRSLGRGDWGRIGRRKKRKREMGT